MIPDPMLVILWALAVSIPVMLALLFAIIIKTLIEEYRS